MGQPIPVPSSQTGLRALKAIWKDRHPLAALQVFHDEMGDIFRINLPGFKPIVLVGPEAARFVLVQERAELCWRNERDPVTKLLGHGLLVEDGVVHDELRRVISPSLHRKVLAGYLQIMLDSCDQITAKWEPGVTLDMLIEMRKIALLILNRSLFSQNFTPELESLWNSVIKLIRYISPGIWMLWVNAPRPGYQRAIHQMDDYLFDIIQLRRLQIADNPYQEEDLLSALIAANLNERIIRDQLLTMLIAGHDTSTANLAWTLYLLGKNPEIVSQLQHEIDLQLGDHNPTVDIADSLRDLGNVIKESLRLYPPIHLGSRVANKDLEYRGFNIPAGERVIYSIYLTQRHKGYWDDPHSFNPDRFKIRSKPEPYSYLAFGGGPRNCIGAAFGQLETRIVLARLLQKFHFRMIDDNVRPYMGATLEPKPGVMMTVTRRK